jgi:hypothetical protein
LGFGVWGLGFRVWSLGFGFGVCGVEFGFEVWGFKVLDFVFWFLVFGFRTSGFEFRVSGFELENRDVKVISGIRCSTSLRASAFHPSQLPLLATGSSQMPALGVGSSERFGNWVPSFNLLTSCKISWLAADYEGLQVPTRDAILGALATTEEGYLALKKLPPLRTLQ